MTRLCKACPDGWGTTDLMQTECMSCHDMWKIGQQEILFPENSIELALSYKICKDPTEDPTALPPPPLILETESKSSNITTPNPVVEEEEVITVGSTAEEELNLAAILVPIFLLLVIGCVVGIVFYVRHRQRKNQEAKAAEQPEPEPIKEIVTFSF